MSGQTDLFGAVPANPPIATVPPPRHAEPHFPTPPSLQWARRLDEAGVVARQVEWNATWGYTGVVAEQLSVGPTSRLLLYANGEITEIKPDPGQSGRIIFCSPKQAAALHAARPLIQIGTRGTHAARYRLARPGETPAKLAEILEPPPPSKSPAGDA